MIITALQFYESKHGKDCDFLNKASILDLMEQYAQKFYSNKLQQTIVPNDTYAEVRQKFPDPPLKDLP